MSPDHYTETDIKVKVMARQNIQQRTDIFGRHLNEAFAAARLTGSTP